MNAGSDTFQPRAGIERRHLNPTGRGQAQARLNAEMAATKQQIAQQHNAMLGYGNTDTGIMSSQVPGNVNNASLDMLGYQTQTDILKKFQEGREFYIQEMQKAIMGLPNQYFHTPLGYTSSNVVTISENDGNAKISEMGVNHPYNRALVRSQDKNIASMMLFPGTDMLAYSRSIESPHVTTHTATFGF